MGKLHIYSTRLLNYKILYLFYIFNLLYFNLNNIYIGQARVSDLAFSILNRKTIQLYRLLPIVKNMKLYRLMITIVEFVDLSVHVRHVYKFHYNWTEI